MAITASGIGSGIDINGLVADLISAERLRPEQLLNNRESDLNGQISSIGQLKSALSTFQDALKKLTSAADFKIRSASSNDTTVVDIRADQSATPGSYNIEVISLASADKLISNSAFADSDTTAIGTGNLTIANSNGDSFTLNFAGGGDNTLAQIADRINADANNFGVNATVLNIDGGSKLVLTAEDTGLSNALTITTDSIDGLANLTNANLTALTSAADGSIKVDNQTVTISENTVSGVIPGVELELKGSGTTTVSVKFDQEAVADNVQAFVDAYNAVQSKFEELAGYNGGKPGPLFGDTTIKGLESRLRGYIAGSVSGVPSGLNSLSLLGINSSPETGELSLNKDKLLDALNSNANAVATVFADSIEGITVKMDAIIEEYVKFGGLLSEKTDSLNNRLSLIDDARERLDYRLDKREARLTKQFIAMDALVASINTTGDYVTQQLSNLPGFTKPK
jgi:flagellar hook-associated protein 2